MMNTTDILVFEGKTNLGVSLAISVEPALTLTLALPLGPVELALPLALVPRAGTDNDPSTS